MSALELSGMTLGLREGLIGLIALVAVYIIFVLLRMFRLRQRPSGTENPASQAAVPVGGGQTESMPADLAPSMPEAAPPANWDPVPNGMAEDVLRHGLELELAQLREEVDAIRGELAALRGDMHNELASLRASQSVSPIYGDAMQLAVSGYDAAAIAERCGIARAEADLVVALAKSQEH